MATNELKRLKITYPGESSGCKERLKELNLTEWNITGQSIQLEGTDRVRMSSICPKGEQILKTYYDDVNTLYNAFQRGLGISGNANCLGWRNSGEEDYQWLSYKEVHKRARAFGSGLIKHGVAVGQDTRLGIFSKNCVEWALTEQAASMFSMVVVPFYDSLSPSACRHICNTTEMKVIVCNSERNASQILEAPEKVPSLQTIIIMTETSKEFIEKAGEKGVTVLQFKDVEASGSDDLQEPVPPKPDDICTICFTSGTTGNPKGVILTHGNLICGCNGTFAILTERFEFRTGDVLISYLPLAHMYERYLEVLMFMHGASVGFFRGDPKFLLDDMASLKPTIFPCVPRVMNKIYDTVWGSVSEKNKISQMIFRKAFEAKKKEILSGTIRNNGLWDFVFKGVRKLHGGNIRLITTGAAPISPEIKMFFRIIFGCLVLEAYGQTETGGPITITHPNDLSDGHVGMVFPVCLIKLVDVPELDYFSEKNQGEMCVKGPSTFKGYYRDQEKTNATIDGDGYVHTGDVGEWLPNGQLKIIDRVKHIFKLSQGEYVAPERVENEYIRTEGVAQIFVHGESLEDSCIAIVVPDEKWVEKVSKQRQWEGDFTTLCGKQELRDLLFEKMNQVARKSDLKGFERVKKIHVHSVPFSEQNNFLTPTFKSKRPNLRKYFKDITNEMYSDMRAQRKEPTSQRQSNGASTSERVEAENGAEKKGPEEDDNKGGEGGQQKGGEEGVKSGSTGGKKKGDENDDRKGVEEGEQKGAEEEQKGTEGETNGSTGGKKKGEDSDDDKRGVEEGEQKGAEEDEKIGIKGKETKGAEVDETKGAEEEERKEAEDNEAKEEEKKGDDVVEMKEAEGEKNKGDEE